MITDDFNQIETKAKRAVSRTALKLHSDLVKVAPVDTGAFKLAWKIKKKSDFAWDISNNMEYASMLWRGHSKQWNGGDAMLAKANIDLQRKLNMIRV